MTTSFDQGDGQLAASRFAARFIPAWLDIALPPGDGPAPVVEALGDDGPRTTLAQCRTAFMLAHLHLVTGRQDLLVAAVRICDFAMAHLRDPDGGFRYAVAPDGGPLDAPETRLRRSYDQSFALLALATLHRADATRFPKSMLDACWRFIETSLIDPATGGLWEDDRGAEASVLRAQNPQMHMLEATLQAFEMTSDPVWLERARGFVTLALERLIDPATGAVCEFVGPDLRPFDGAEGARREPGHQYEWAWLLRRYADFAQESAPLAAADRMQAFVEAHGLRRDGPLAGAPFDALDAAGWVTEDTHLLWPLTEAGKLYAARAITTNDAACAARVRQIADTIFGRYFAADGAPIWTNRLDAEGRVIWDAALSRLLYHVAVFVTEGSRAGLWTLEE